MSGILGATMPQLLTAREAAGMLAISERHLWGLTKTGKILAVRIGRAVRYRRESLEQFATAQEGRRPNREAGQPNEPGN